MLDKVVDKTPPILFTLHAQRSHVRLIAESDAAPQLVEPISSHASSAQGRCGNVLAWFRTRPESRTISKFKAIDENEHAKKL